MMYQWQEKALNRLNVVLVAVTNLYPKLYVDIVWLYVVP